MATFTVRLPAVRHPALRRRYAALAPGQWLQLVRGVDNTRAAHTVTVVEPGSGEAIGQLARDERARVLRAMAEDGDIAVRVARVRQEGRLWWRRVTVELDVLTAGDARAVQPAEEPGKIPA